MNTILNDLRFGLRQLAKTPTFTVIVVLTLAIGIGANTVVYSWIDTVLLNSIPEANNARKLVAIVPANKGNTFDSMSYPDARDLAEQTTTLEGVTGSDMAMMSLNQGGTPEWVWGQVVMSNFFRVLEVQAALGQVEFPATEADVGNAPYVVISHRYWQTNLGGDPSVIGREVSINNHSFTIIGVAAEGFMGSVGGLRFDIWLPLAMGEPLDVTPGLTDDKRGWHWLKVIARLKEDVSWETAKSELEVIGRRLASENADAGSDDSLALLPLWKSPGGSQEVFLPLLRALFVVASFVFLLVVASVANLLLARSTVRLREVGVRLAMGASRARVIRLLILESMILTGLGCIVGIGLAYLGVDLLSGFMPVSHLPTGLEVRISWTVIGLMVGLGLLTGLIFGLAPSWSLVRTPLAQLMGDSARGSESRSSRLAFRRLLVLGQFAIALVVVVSAGLCVKSLSNAQRIDLGFNPDGLWVAGFRLDTLGYNNSEATQFYQRLDERLRSMSGVSSVAFSDFLPLGFEEGGGGGISLSGYQPYPGEQMSAGLCRVLPGFFETLGIPMLDGRDFRYDDNGKAPLVAVINQTMAERFFAGREPLGQTVQLWGADRTIVGVVGNTKNRQLNEPRANVVFIPQAQLGPANLFAIVRSSKDLQAMGSLIASAAREIDPNVTVWHSISFRDYIQPAFFLQRVAATLLSALGLLTLLLASMGLYAVIAFNVSRRTRELGIRLALGSLRSGIHFLILRQGAYLALMGLMLGTVVAFGVSRLLRSFLLDVEPSDPITFLTAAAILLIAALAGCWIPARRAANTNPIIALRSE